ncbi:MAG: hypothetical protein IPG22_06070 [Acidobacteria bacterium]|nr:hypothetical protein [Acidobacteriota bacterium]
MWSKLYLALLGLSLVVMAFFSFYSWSWLQSIGIPAQAAAGYEYHAGFAWTALWLTTAILVPGRKRRQGTGGRAWAMWITFVYFAVLAVVRLSGSMRHLFILRRSTAFPTAPSQSGHLSPCF